MSETAKRNLTPARMEADRAVYGHNVRWDDNGYPVEQGVGSRSNMTPEHRAAKAREKQGK